jgi:hypothetical protein
MKLLPIVTAAALLAGTGLAGAQATNFSIAPGNAKALSGSGTDFRDWRVVQQRRMMERNPHYGMHESWWNYPANDRYAHGSGWNAYGSGVGVQVGPVGVGAGPYGAGVGIGPFGVGVGTGAWPYHGGYYHDGRWH